MAPSDDFSQEEACLLVFFSLKYRWRLGIQAWDRMGFLGFLLGHPCLLCLQALLFYYCRTFLVHSSEKFVPLFSTSLMAVSFGLWGLVCPAGRVYSPDDLVIYIHHTLRGGLLSFASHSSLVNLLRSSGSNLIIRWQILAENATVIGKPQIDVSPMDPNWHIAFYILAKVMLEMIVVMFQEYSNLWIVSGETRQFGGLDYLNAIITEF